MRRLAGLLLLSQAFAATPPRLRLPASVRPTRYALELTIDPAQKELAGEVTVDVEVTETTALVWMNATDLKIDEARVDGAKAAVVAGDDDFFAVQPAAPLERGRARIALRYRGHIDDVRSRGLYRVDENGAAYLYTNFEPIDARRVFPCFDEPSFKVPWQLTFHVPKGNLALGNAPVVTTKDEGGRVRVELAPTRPLPSYLVAFVVGPFELVDGGRAGRTKTAVRFIVPRGRGAETRWARVVTPRIVDELERYFDLDYPYEKLDVAVVPRYWGTMEHPGIVALGQPLTLIRPDEESLQRRQRYANIAVHELGHYWFGDYVTCAWWDDTWLNESLGSWIDGKITDRVEPAWKWQPRHALQRMTAALEADALPTVQSIHLPVTDKNAIENSFDGNITYNKGSSLVRMVEHWMGEERFRRAVGGYLRAHAYANASAGDFIAAVRAADAQAADSFASFVDQPGVPLISVEKRCDKMPHLVVTQRRFLSTGKGEGRWKVPVCLEWEGGQKCVLLSEASAEVPLDRCPAWVVPNQGAFGYYRSRWDAGALLPVLAKRPFAERVLLADDTAALAEEGSVPLGEALALQPALLADPELPVFRRGLALFFLLHRAQLDDKGRAAFDRAVEKLVGPRAATLGMVARADEDPELPATREATFALLGRVAGDAKLVKEARAAVERWLGDRKSLSPDLVDVLLQIAAGDGDAAWFDRLLAEARRARDLHERGQLLRALGAFRDPALAERALGLVRGREFDVRESIDILYLQFGDRVTRPAAWRGLKAGWDGIVSRMRDDESLWLIRFIAGSACDVAERDDLAKFLGERAKSRMGAPQALRNGLDRADACIAAVARNGGAVSEFLSRF